MDQNKTNVPNLCPTPKAVQTVFRLQTHCTGVLAHTKSHKGKKAYALYDICQFPQDVNLTLHALIHVLLDFTENLPEVLYLQLDNAGNQNKNRYLLGFCALLVEKKIFRKVHNIVRINQLESNFCLRNFCLFMLMTYCTIRCMAGNLFI